MTKDEVLAGVKERCEEVINCCAPEGDGGWSTDAIHLAHIILDILDEEEKT